MTSADHLNHTLGHALRNAAGRPPVRQVASVITKAIHSDIEPSRAIAWLRHQRFASVEVRDLAGNRPRMRTLIRDVQRHTATTHDPRAVAERAAAWMLIVKPSHLTDEQHRVAQTAVAVVARRTTGPEVEDIGDGTFISEADIGVVLGISRQGAAKRLRLASELGAFDLRYRSKAGTTSKLRLKNVAHDWWVESLAEPGAAAFAAALEAGDTSALDALLHPALAYSNAHLQQADALLLLFTTCDVDPRARGFNPAALSRSRRRLRSAEVSDIPSLLRRLDEYLDDADANGVTPRARFVAAQTARRDHVERRTAEATELRDARRAASIVDGAFGVGFTAAGRVRPLVLATLGDVGAPGDLTRDALRSWCERARRSLAPLLSNDVDRAAAASILAGRVVGAGRSSAQNVRLAELTVGIL